MIFILKFRNESSWFMCTLVYIFIFLQTQILVAFWSYTRINLWLYFGIHSEMWERRFVDCVGYTASSIHEMLFILMHIVDILLVYAAAILSEVNEIDIVVDVKWLNCVFHSPCSLLLRSYKWTIWVSFDFISCTLCIDIHWNRQLAKHTAEFEVIVAVFSF